MWHSLMKWENITVEILLVTFLTYEGGLRKKIYGNPTTSENPHLLTVFMSDVAG